MHGTLVHWYSTRAVAGRPGLLSSDGSYQLLQNVLDSHGARSSFDVRTTCLDVGNKLESTSDKFGHALPST